MNHKMQFAASHAFLIIIGYRVLVFHQYANWTKQRARICIVNVDVFCLLRGERIEGGFASVGRRELNYISFFTPASISSDIAAFITKEVYTNILS
jgi:hypothetical protein